MNSNSHDTAGAADRGHNGTPSKEKIEIYVNSSVTRVLALKLRELDRLFTSADRALGGGQLSVEHYMELTGSSAAMIKTMDNLANEYRSHGGIKVAHDQLTGRRRPSNWKKQAPSTAKGAPQAKAKPKSAANGSTPATSTVTDAVTAPETAAPAGTETASTPPAAETVAKAKAGTGSKSTKASVKAPDVAV